MKPGRFSFTFTCCSASSFPGLALAHRDIKWVRLQFVDPLLFIRRAAVPWLREVRRPAWGA